MLGKLMKYEFRSNGRLFILIYAAILAVAFIGGIVVNGDVRVEVSIPFLILCLLYILLIMALTVITVIVIVGRFYKNLLSQEGYLMHVLPVPAWNHVVSKLITAVVWIALAIAVIILSGLLFIAGSGSFEEFREIFQTDIIRDVFSRWGNEIALVTAAMFVSFARLILQFYVSMAIGASASRHKILYSFLVFIVTIVVINVITSLTNQGAIVQVVDASGNGVLENADIISGMVFDGICAVIFYILTVVFLKRRLNLE